MTTSIRPTRSAFLAYCAISALGGVLWSAMTSLIQWGFGGSPHPVTFVAGFLIGTHILFLAPIIQPRIREAGEIDLPKAFALVLVVWLFFTGFYIATESTASAYGAAGGLILFWLVLMNTAFSKKGRLLQAVEALIYAGTGGAALALLAQVETRFSEEELIVALEWAALFLLLLALWILTRLPRLWANPPGGRWVYRISSPTWALPIRRSVLALFIFALGMGAGIFFLRAYQASFYPPTAPVYPGISSMSPYRCGVAAASLTARSGEEIAATLASSVAENPGKGVPEFGLLALSTGDPLWADAFREAILDEARQELFTGPANSVKFDQYLAGQRVYYYSHIQERFPGLFTPQERELLKNWFAAINRRALTVEWVDLFYAAAMNKLPDGPYENQENGLGLLALLAVTGLEDPELQEENLAYLETHPGGWNRRFRVTDDAAVYQPEWIENAWYQSMLTGSPGNSNQGLSFEWLKIMALPDGAPLRYNHTGSVSMENIALLGTSLTRDPELLWLAGRSLEYLEDAGTAAIALPGGELQSGGTSRSPTIGSCLLFGDSGLPNQIGPLAPDKIVFRSGWNPEDAYLQLNLRFTGWHRYKATNSISLIYKRSPLVIDNTTGDPLPWFPEGRSIFRDKRIPRENLNGLVIPRTGMSEVLFTLTGIGSPWAQDPPFYARIESFETSREIDRSSTVLEDWRGWDHRRKIIFHKAGPIVVIDEALGPRTPVVELGWNLVGEAARTGDRFLYPPSTADMAVIAVPLSDSAHVESRFLGEEENITRVKYTAEDTSQIQTVTVFLPAGWIEDRVEIAELDTGFELIIEDRDGSSLKIPFNFEGFDHG